MNRLLLATICLFFFISFSNAQSLSQYRRDSIDLLKVKNVEIVLDTTIQNKNTALFPVGSIKIIDVRFDTTHIGLYSQFSNVLIPSIKNNKITLKGGVAGNLQNSLARYFHANLSNVEEQLVCFVKKINVLKRDTLRENVHLNKNVGQVQFQFDVFLKSKGGYFPCFKIDTTIVEMIGVTNKKETVQEIKDNLIIPALQMLNNEINRVDWKRVLTKKMFAEELVLKSYTEKRFAWGILLQPYRKGVFKTFAEFKNNEPSIREFSVKQEKYRTVSLIDGNGDYINTIKTFGYCDGFRLWIQKGNMCFPLMRTGNSFEFFWTIMPEINLKLIASIDMDQGGVL